MENIYYVYIHTRLDTGSVFYVGKGRGRRAWDIQGRNIYWNRIANKTEWIHSIVQDGMSEDDAYLLEQWLIAKFRHNGVKLCNMTDGGTGGLGIPSTRRRKIYCSNGMSFECGNHAAEWLRKNGYQNARQGHIASCCRNERARAYGHAWSYDGIPVDDAPMWKDAISIANSKPVNCSNGMRFESCVIAAKWVSLELGREAMSAKISDCANNKTGGSYGYAWWYDGDEPRDYIPQKRRIECIGFGIFDSMRDACAWISSHTKFKAQSTPIKNAADGKYEQAYGYTWRYPK